MCKSEAYLQLTYADIISLNGSMQIRREQRPVSDMLQSSFAHSAHRAAQSASRGTEHASGFQVLPAIIGSRRAALGRLSAGDSATLVSSHGGTATAFELAATAAHSKRSVLLGLGVTYRREGIVSVHLPAEVVHFTAAEDQVVV